MRKSKLLAVLSLLAIASISRADEKSLVPNGGPPAFATIKGIDPKTQTLVLWIKTIHFEPNNGVFLQINTEIIGVLPLASTTFSEANGKTIEPKELNARLKVGTAVVIAPEGRNIESSYLQTLAKDTIIVRAAVIQTPPGVNYQSQKAPSYSIQR